jgi:hypothetical protein
MRQTRLKKEDESMPNGGPDNCGHCVHNPDGGWCQLRDVMIVEKMWTYCANCTSIKPDDPNIVGPIYSSGQYEGYVRLPWLNDRRPKAGKPVKCYDCGDFVEDGVEIELRSGDKFGFCCNQNYLKWWLNHPDIAEDLKVGNENLEGLKGCPKKDGQTVNAFVLK